jgi:hypothetical protein
MTIDDGDRQDHAPNGNGNGHSGRALLEDEDLAEQFERLVSAAHAKGYSEEEIGFGLMSAAVESQLASGEQECCVMQLLLDFTSSYYEYWHTHMGEAGDDEAELGGVQPESN